jgi:hypothetical protein
MAMVNGDGGGVMMGEGEGGRSRFLLPISSRQIFESISDFFPPNFRVDFYCRFLPAKLMSRFLLPISSRQIDESIISIADFFPPN